MASYVLTLEDRPDHLFARVTARFDSLALAVKYWSEIAIECRRRGREQVLVVRSVSVPARRTDTFQLAGALRDLGFGSLRIAYVDLSPDAHAAVAFGEAVSMQRGIEARSFAAVDRAAEWLGESAGFAPPLRAASSAA